MLPTTGFFKDIDCPCYDISCGRPYCHFRHRKKNQEPAEERTVPQEESTEIPTYKPTPKSELANTKSHIPISYVPDLVIRTDRVVRPVPTFNLADRPTYKPTPISILASTNVSSDCEYKPTSIKLTEDEDDENYEIGDIDLSTELEMIDEILRDSTLLKETSLGEKNKNKSLYTPTKLKDIKHSSSSKKDKSDQKKIKKDEKQEPPKKDKHSSNNKSKHRDKEKDDEHKSKKENDHRSKKEKDKVYDHKGKKEKEDDHKPKKEKEDDHKVKKDKEKDDNKIKKEKQDDHYERVKKDKEKDDTKVRKEDDRHSRKNKERDENHRTKKDDNDKSKKDKNSDNEHHSRRDKEKEDEQKSRKEKDSDNGHQSKKDKEDDNKSGKVKEKKDDHKSKKYKEKDDDHRSRKEKEKVSSSNNTNKDKHRNNKEKESDKHSRDKEKSKSKSNNNSNENASIKKEKHSERNNRDKDKRRSSEEHESNKKNKSRSTKSHRDKSKTKDSSKYESNDKKTELDLTDEKVDYLNSDDDFELEEDTIEEECYKIFNEYKAPDMDILSQITAEDLIAPEPYNPTVIGKKRVAYEKADQVHQKITHAKPNSIVNVAVMMANRIKIARQAQAQGNHHHEQKNVITELRKQCLKRRLSSELFNEQSNNKIRKTVKEPKKEVISTNVIDDIINGKSVSVVDDSNKFTIKPRNRIAPVQNVMSIQRAKAKLDEMARKKAVGITLAQTTNKGSKRVAHIPDTSLSDIPDVLQAERSKLPVNVRTRYLTMLASECTKLYMTKDDAYQRALNEEVKCYERCSALVTYRNSAMLAVNRLRKEIQERETSGLGPISEGELNNKTNNSPFQGEQFYDTISSFILTEDDLFLHGYPREGSITGKAIINTEHSRQVHNDHLEPNERICCRCHKMYMIDDDGFSLYNEECIYHPLRMRTLRGERTYLCCKSSSETGCAMSNTHVSEASAERLLDGYQSTLEPDREEDPRSHSIYALDCEMCYTTIGLELTRVTIVDTNLKTVYESLVKPLNPIIDYNTRFSGITKEQMDKTSTSILQVQANILHLCNSKTILIGHSLESDMKALKIIHGTIIDTAVMFPHKFGLPHKRALRVLASEHLKKIIQNDVSGHDSAEDAITCMELVIWRVKEDFKVKGVKY